MLRWFRRKLATLTLLILSLLILSSSLTSPPVTGLTWSAGVKLTPALSIETKPYVMEDDKGVLWVTYESLRSANFDVYARRWNGTSWSPEERLTNDAAADQNPALVQLTNGTILLVWASDRSGGLSLFSKMLNGGVWSAETRLTTSPGKDSTPSLLQARNGTLWVFWSRTTLVGNKVIQDIYYKTYTSNVWSQDLAFANTAAAELHQSIVQSDDETIWVLYSSNESGNFDLYYNTYRGTWSLESRLTATSDDDRQAWIMQALNGTMWVFWSRCIRSGSTCHDDVFYRFSHNQGLFWYAETQFTFDPTGTEIADIEPAAVHARDKKIYLFWTTNLTGDGGDFDIYYSTSTIIPIHDVGILNAAAYPTTVEPGRVVKVNITAANFGDYNEVLSLSTFFENQATSVMVLVNSTTLSLQPGRSTKIQVSWNTSGITPVPSPLSYYKIIITIQPAPGESIRRQGDNVAEAGNIRVLPTIIPGDVDQDGDVDIFDAVALTINWGQKMGPEDFNGDCAVDIFDAVILTNAYGSRPGGPRWNAKVDLNRDGIIDVIDYAQLSSKYGLNLRPMDFDRDCDVDLTDALTLALWYDIRW